MLVTVDTSVQIKTYTQSDAMTIGVMVAACSMLALTVAVCGFVVVNRTHSVIQASSPFFCVMTVLGIASAFAFIVAWVPYEPSTASCVTSTWYDLIFPITQSDCLIRVVLNALDSRGWFRLGHVGFGLAYGALFMKTSRSTPL